MNLCGRRSLFDWHANTFHLENNHESFFWKHVHVSVEHQIVFSFRLICYKRCFFFRVYSLFFCSVGVVVIVFHLFQYTKWKSFNMHLFNYKELNRAHEKTTIFIRRHLKCYAKSSEAARIQQKKKYMYICIVEESHTRVLPGKFNAQLLNTEFTSARTFCCFTIFHLICINLEATMVMHNIYIYIFFTFFWSVRLRFRSITKLLLIKLCSRNKTIFTIRMQHDLGVLFKYRYKYLVKWNSLCCGGSAINCGIYCQNRDNYKMSKIMSLHWKLNRHIFCEFFFFVQVCGVFCTSNKKTIQIIEREPVLKYESRIEYSETPNKIQQIIIKNFVEIPFWNEFFFRSVLNAYRFDQFWIDKQFFWINFSTPHLWT